MGKDRWLPGLIVLFLLLAGSAAGCELRPGSLPEGRASAPPAADAVPPTSSSKPTDSDTGLQLPPEGGVWQWQLTDLPLDLSRDADIYDIDLFDNDPGTMALLQEQGRYVICYLNAGSWEDWRPDAADFPEQILGRKYQGWPGERWLDIRQIDLLAPILLARLDLCRAKGFDGVEPDNQDGYLNDTGFPLTYQDQLAFNIWLADQAHQRGLSIGLKNAPEQAQDLVGYYDWALAEDCFTEGWCADLAVFREAGKAVLAAEYTDRLSAAAFLEQVCPQAEALGFSVILKDRDLGSWRQTCP